MDKPTIRVLCVAHGIDLLLLSQASSVHPYRLWDLVREVPMPRQEAGMVVRAINELAHTQYTVQELHIPLITEGIH